MREFPDRDPGRPDRSSAGRFLWWLARRQAGLISACVGFGVACMLAQALIPAVIGRAVDAGMIAQSKPALVLWGMTVLGLAMVQALTSIMRDRFTLTNRVAATSPTLQLVTRHAARLGVTLPRRVSAGEAVSVGVSDISTVGVALSRIGRGSGAAVGVITVAVLMISVSWRLGLVVLLGVPSMVWLLSRLIRPFNRRQQALRDQQGELTGKAMDIVGGLRVLRGLGGEDVFTNSYRQASQRLRRATVEAARQSALIDGVKILLPGLLAAAVVWLGANLVVAGQLSAGQLVAFYAYAVFLIGPLRWLTFTTNDLTKGHVAARRIIDFLAVEPDLRSADAGAVVQQGAALVDPEAGIAIEQGRLTAVCCAAPDEASLLADRLGRYVDSAVTFGGVPLVELPIDEVRRRVHVVHNDALLFVGPLRRELDPAALSTTTPGLLEEATDVASARDIIEAAPGGFDAMVEEAGRNFSGGERQRLRLVRALMTEPEVLVLVEPTSAVDAHTESRIAQRLRAHRAGRTTVVFTNNPIMLDQADHVAYVEDGRVVTEGAPGNVLSNARFRQLVLRENTS